MSEERMPVKKLEEFLEYGKTHPEVFGCSGIERYFEFQQNADLKQHNEIMKAERKKWAREEADWLEKFVLPSMSQQVGSGLKLRIVLPSFTKRQERQKAQSGTFTTNSERDNGK